MAFKGNSQIKPFENKIWLSSPTMHGDELKYMTEAFQTNWMSTVGSNLNEVEHSVAEFMGVKCGSSFMRNRGSASCMMSADNQLNHNVILRCKLT